MLCPLENQRCCGLQAAIMKFGRLIDVKGTVEFGFAGAKQDFARQGA
jgi:hypothetical protein